jgi:hypothetical protein
MIWKVTLMLMLCLSNPSPSAIDNNMSLYHYTVCRNRTAILCYTCSSAGYCSGVFCEEDKRVHGILRKDFASRIASTTRPSDTCSLTFYFPVSGVAPELIWFENGQQHKKDEVTGIVTASNLFGDGMPEFSSYSKVATDLFLEVQMRKDVKSKKSPLNMTILYTTQGQQRDLWRGPIVVCALCDGTPGLRRNVIIQDFSALVTCLEDSGHDKFTKVLRSGKLREVEVNNPSISDSRNPTAS